MIWVQIARFPRYEITADGSVRNRDTGRVMAIVTVKGYYKVGLCDGVTRQKLVSVHRLIWEAFAHPIPDGMCINHIDGDKKNNALANLEVVTAQENTAHAKRAGLVLRGDNHPARRRPETRPRGEKCYQSKLTEYAVLDIRHRAKSGASFAELGREYGVDPVSISYAVNRKTWRHI